MTLNNLQIHIKYVMNNFGNHIKYTHVKYVIEYCMLPTVTEFILSHHGKSQYQRNMHYLYGTYQALIQHEVLIS